MSDRGPFDRITFDPRIMAGRAWLRGRRVPVPVILGQITGGASAEQILVDHPDLEADDIKQTLAYAAWLTREEVVPA